MNRMKTDVLVIGGGAAGIRAAMEAAANSAEVTLENNVPVTTHGSSFSPRLRGSGIQVLLDDEASAQHTEKFYDEIVAVITLSFDNFSQSLLSILQQRRVRILTEPVA
jgi:succinate dehydrogenase/fumarate reductase flavoprotein subunit